LKEFKPKQPELKCSRAFVHLDLKTVAKHGQQWHVSWT